VSDPDDAARVQYKTREGVNDILNKRNTRNEANYTSDREEARDGPETDRSDNLNTDRALIKPT
jgi:hypothetical protein